MSIMDASLFDDTTIESLTRPKPHPRDRIWEALAEWFGEPATQSERKLRNKILYSLKGAGATAELIHERCQAWPKLFPGATLTITALEKHWTQLGLQPLQSESDFMARGHASCVNCDGRGFIESYAPGAGTIKTPCRS